MKILITGSSGFIGKSLSSFLSKKHEVFLLKRMSHYEEHGLILADLSSPENIKYTFSNGANSNLTVDVIIHCASMLASPDDYYNINLFHINNKISESLIYITKKLKVKKLINFSTIGVYSYSDGIYEESSHIDMSDSAECLYSLSKFCSEQLFSFFLKDVQVINLRLSQTFGIGMREDRIYSIYLKELQDFNTITVWGNGERMSNFISIEYLQTIIDKIISNDKMSGTYNVGEENISYLDLADRLIKKFGTSESKIIKVEKGVKSKIRIDCSKIKNALKHE